MSFSSDVKAELSKQYRKSRHCQLAELAAMLEFGGGYAEGIVFMNTDNPLVSQKFSVLMQKAFSIDIKKPLSEEDKIKVSTALRLGSLEQKLLVQQTCCKRAYLRGAFMVVGSMSDPNKSYHFEIVCETMRHASMIQELMGSFEMDAKIVRRKNHFVVYLKEGSQIVDMLNVMEAYVSLMDLENVRIIKEVRNTVNRKVNCETANINKTVSAAVKQIEDIRKIENAIGLDDLPEALGEVARLRLEYPEATLKELGERLDPPIGKSGVNHRLRKLSILAEDL